MHVNSMKSPANKLLTNIPETEVLSFIQTHCLRCSTWCDSALQNSAWLPWRGLVADCTEEKPNAGEVAGDWGSAKCSSDVANDFQPPTWKSDTPTGHPDLHALLSTSADEDAPLPAVNANSGLKSWRVERWDRMREFPSGGFICWSAFHRMTTVLKLLAQTFYRENMRN